MTENPTTDLVIKTRIADMVEAWTKAQVLITDACKSLEEARVSLVAAFMAGDPKTSFSFRMFANNAHAAEVSRPQEIIDRLKAEAWTVIMSHLDVDRTMSFAASKELHEQLANPQSLPPLTRESITSILLGLAQSIESNMREAISETYDFLRPHRVTDRTLVTNDKNINGLQERVIIECVDVSYSGNLDVKVGSWVPYLSKLRILDNCFHWLDGQGIAKGNFCPLVDAIRQTKLGQIGRTNYFEFKGFKNGNLHLRFLRADLVARFNEQCGSALLPHK